MPQPKIPAEEVAKEKVVTPDEGEAPFFSVDQIIAEAGRLGLDPAEVAGAFAGVAGSKEITVKEAKDRVRSWAKAPVATDDSNS